MNAVTALTLFIVFLVSSCNNIVSSSHPKKIDTVALREQCLQEARPAYINAYTQIDQLKQNMRLAVTDKEKDAIVEEYNRNLGVEMGHLYSVKDIKNRLDTSGENYIKFKWYRAAAEVATRMAAESKFEADRLSRGDSSNNRGR